MKSRIEEGSTSPEPLAGVCPSWNEGRTQQLAFQFVFDPIHDVALPTDAVNCYRVLALSLLSVFGIKFRPFPIFHWENEVLPQTVPTPHVQLAKRRKRKQKRFLSTWINIFFQTSVLSYIVSFYRKHKEMPTSLPITSPTMTFWELCRNVKGDGNIWSFLNCLQCACWSSPVSI